MSRYLHHHRFAVTVLLSFFVLSNILFAAEENGNVISRMNQMISQGQFQEAYALGQENLFDLEGEADFDFLYGMAALESGRPNEAVFAFERIAYIYPDQQRVKLELARAYFMSNNLAASEQLFNEVLATNPGPNVSTNIEAFLDLIEQRQEAVSSTFTWYVNSNIGSDSNINSATELGVIATPIGDVELGANGQSIDDNFMDIGTGFNYNYPFDKNQSAYARVNFNQHNNFSTNDFDLDVFAGEAGYAVIRDNSRLSLGGRVQRVDLDNEEFQSSASILGSFQRNAGDGWSQGMTAAYTTVRYEDDINPDNSLRDVNQILVSGSLGKASGRFLHNLSVYIGDEDAQRSAGENHAQKFYGIAFSEQFQYRPGHIPYFRISFHKSENKDTAPFFNVDREDDTFSTSLGWIWQFARNINITTDVTYTDNDSNILIYTYDRVKYQTGLRYQF
jgi:tetratricopeptide (TPR) repeat protein